MIRLKSKKPFGFAGLYNKWVSPTGEVICTCTIITTEANDLLRQIHNRMPVIIPEDKRDLWLSPEVNDKEVLIPLLKAYPSEEMEYYDVSSMVNSARNNSSECIKPAESEF